MATDSGSIKQNSIEQRSESVKKLSNGILNELDNFLSNPKPTEGKDGGMPSPLRDALTQIDENLDITEKNLGEIRAQFDRLKARIR